MAQDHDTKAGSKEAEAASPAFTNGATAPSMMGNATGMFGSALVQRKIARRRASSGGDGGGDAMGGDVSGGDVSGGDGEVEENHPLGGDPPAGAAPAKEAAPAPTPAAGTPATSISTSDLAAPAWAANGGFKWWVRWVTDGRSGWIVQRIDNTYSGTKKGGAAITNASVGAIPSYYEAWAVDAAGGITGSNGGTGNRDRWERPEQGEGSKGNWTMRGEVHFTNIDPSLSGMASRNVANAGSLLSSLTAPAHLSGVLQARTAKGEWDATSTPPIATHGATT